uniref:Tc1-like transposase DDE domain-containing protein n=1 Tax=Phytophthora ramorum TaxID=164328 RepID=H3GL51_PHYRM
MRVVSALLCGSLALISVISAAEMQNEATTPVPPTKLREETNAVPSPYAQGAQDAAMKEMVAFDFGVDISTSTISDKFIGMLYTVKQCAVSTELGLFHHRLERGSIRMDVSAAFVDAIYDKVRASHTYQEHFRGQKVVVVLDNAPAHSQKEDRVVEHNDLELLRLAPYSPMCDPIEGCFSVLKARIKASLALARGSWW